MVRTALVMWPKLLKPVKLDDKVTFLRKTFDCIFQSVYAVSNCIGMFRIARNHSKKYHLCQKPDRSASARIWIFVLTSPSSGLFWKLWLSPLSLCNLESGPNSAIASLCPEPNHLTLRVYFEAIDFCAVHSFCGLIHTILAHSVTTQSLAFCPCPPIKCKCNL